MRSTRQRRGPFPMAQNQKPSSVPPRAHTYNMLYIASCTYRCMHVCTHDGMCIGCIYIDTYACVYVLWMCMHGYIHDMPVLCCMYGFMPMHVCAVNKHIYT
jgi:hypothetical protein